MPPATVAETQRAFQNSLPDVQFLLVRKQFDGAKVEPIPVADAKVQYQPVRCIDQAFILDRLVGNSVGQAVIAAGDIGAGIMNAIRRRLRCGTTRGEIAVAERTQRLTQRFLCGVETVAVNWEPGRNGDRPPPRPVAGTERTWAADMVLLALGFLGPETTLLEQFGAARDGRGNVKAEYERFATNVPGVFAAGDARRGQSLVVWAIDEGRGAARAVDQFLIGATALL